MSNVLKAISSSKVLWLYPVLGMLAMYGIIQYGVESGQMFRYKSLGFSLAALLTTVLLLIPLYVHIVRKTVDSSTSVLFPPGVLIGTFLLFNVIKGVINFVCEVSIGIEINNFTDRIVMTSFLTVIGLLFITGPLIVQALVKRDLRRQYLALFDKSKL